MLPRTQAIPPRYAAYQGICFPEHKLSLPDMPPIRGYASQSTSYPSPICRLSGDMLPRTQAIPPQYAAYQGICFPEHKLSLPDMPPIRGYASQNTSYPSPIRRLSGDMLPITQAI